jgi:hypothetical protein
MPHRCQSPRATRGERQRARRARSGALAVFIACACGAALATPLDDKAKESGCTSRPEPSNGMYRCQTRSGTAFFNVPGMTPSTSAAGPAGKAAATPTPAGFPRVDTATQKGRDDVRRKVLSDELASEEKLLVEARAAYADGAPSPQPEERLDATKYQQRIARLRQAVGLHERNIEALKKEIASIK